MLCEHIKYQGNDNTARMASRTVLLEAISVMHGFSSAINKCFLFLQFSLRWELPRCLGCTLVVFVFLLFLFLLLLLLLFMLVSLLLSFISFFYCFSFLRLINMIGCFDSVRLLPNHLPPLFLLGNIALASNNNHHSTAINKTTSPSF